MEQETNNGDEPAKTDRPIYRVEVHLFSGKTLTFDAYTFKMEMRDGVRSEMEWEFAPSMLKSGVQLPLLKLLNPNRIEYVTYAELPV